MDIFWWFLLNDINILISNESAKVQNRKSERETEYVSELVIIQLFSSKFHTGSVILKLSLVIAWQLIIFQTGLECPERGKGPVNTSQAANIYPLVRLCTSNGLGPCPGLFTVQEKVPSDLSQLFARCPILYL